jgi:hypothetical protein
MALSYSDIGDLSYVKTLTLDVYGGISHLYINAKQLDNHSRYLEITVLRNGMAFTIPSGTIPRFRCTKPDGTIVFDDGCVYDGKVYVELTEQTLLCKGRARADIGLYLGNSLLSTVTFFIEVSTIPFSENAIISSNEFSSLTAALSQVFDISGTADEALANSNAALENLSTLNAAEAARVAAEIQRAAQEIARQNAEVARVAEDIGRLPYEIAFNSMLAVIEHNLRSVQDTQAETMSSLSSDAGSQTAIDDLMLVGIRGLLNLADDAKRTVFTQTFSNAEGIAGTYTLAIPTGSLRNSLRYTVIAEVTSITGGGSIFTPIIKAKQVNGFQVVLSVSGTVTAASIDFTLIGGMA